MKVGRPRNELRTAYAERYGWSPKLRSKISLRLLEQLEDCKDEDSRRVLLGMKDESA